MAETIRRVHLPTVVVLGSVDSIVPPEQSRAVAGAAAGPVSVVEVIGADHNDAALLDGASVDRLCRGTGRHDYRPLNVKPNTSFWVGR